MSLISIVRACGGDLYAGGRRANIPAPGHSRQDRSVSLWLQDGRVFVHSFGAADWREVMQDLRARGLVDAEGGLTGAPGTAPPRAPEPSESERIEAARRLWSEARPLAGTLSERHLQRRRVERPNAGAALRHHAAVPAAIYTRRGATWPALLAAIHDPAGALTAVEVTYLDRQARRLERRGLGRKTIGRVRSGSAVRLDPPGSELLVAEGVFTTLSAAARFSLPGWALLSIRNLKAWTPPAGVRRVLIAADRGRYGEAAADVLRDRLSAAGVGVTVEIPPPPFGDWNEAEALDDDSTGRG
jgi:hypothetical protein